MPPSRSLVHIRSLASHALKPGKLATSLRYRRQAEQERDTTRPPPVLQRMTSSDDAFRQMSFTFAVIALSARISCIDGPLTKAKYLAFRDAFPLSGGLCGKLRALFTLACENPTPFEHYVNQIKHAFPKKSPLFISLVERLFSVAGADGAMSPKAEWMLARVSHMLDISATQYTDIRTRYTTPPKAHQVLGVPKRSPIEKIKKRYREMMRHYHPDRFAHGTMSPEIELLLQLKVSEINAAYQQLSKRA